ncbi:UbiA family prenyltransferase [Gracilimonas sp. Q87]|uniref:UbiA family prenyltransferase n=1 Tax=Gracilimonas sp. Q87 TaxID=3384766 RepID=UPI0039844A8C
MAALFVDEVNWPQYGLQFLNVHVLLFGGATVYNSWWDKDEGPVGGLESPPKMQRWMWPVSLVIQYLGLYWAIYVGWNFALIYAISMVLFWLYSSPLVRWKGKPILSLIAIGVSTGTNSFFLGYLAAGGYPITLYEDLIALGVACLVLSLYPVSQVFQTEDDMNRGDETFAAKYGLKGIKWLFAVLFPLGTVILSVTLVISKGTAGYVFGGVGSLAYLAVLYLVLQLEGKKSEYPLVMRIKFLASLSFVLFMLTWIASDLLL